MSIIRLHNELMEAKFHFSKLKPAIIPKDNGKNRVICIPTVRDRLVQRTMIAWLVEKNKIPQQDFVYGTKGLGARHAITRAKTLRSTFDWCVKTDIQAFFDNISREKLKLLVAKQLKKSSLLPLLFSAIDLEIKPRNSKQSAEIEASGIKSGIGIRQGMPLSPLLANFSLHSFDAACKMHNIKILRYADDILAFFHTKQDAQDGFNRIKEALKKLELFVPEIGQAKTELIGKSDPVSFLGREIVYLDQKKCYVDRVGAKKLTKIKEALSKDYAIKRVMEENRTLDEAISSLSASIRSYFGAYKDAHDYTHFQNEIRGHYKQIINLWFREIFGTEAISGLSLEQRKFLGIQVTEDLDAVEDMELAS